MSQRILFVDDEPNVLDGLRRLLRKRYEYDTAPSGAEALELVATTDYAVVVSDMRMPGMMGDELLAKVCVEQPEAVLMILSGQADMSSTIAAVNNSNLYRFLVKPVDREVLVAAIDGALEQHRLVRAERELLDGTLSGAVSALTQVVALANPAASRQSSHVVDLVGRLAPAADLQRDWQLRLAALLSGIGYSSVPADVMERFHHGDALGASEAAMIGQHGQVAMQLLEPIPRLEGVAAIIGAQAGARDPDPALVRHTEVLDVAVAVASLLVRGRDLADAAAVLRDAGGHDAALLDALDHHSEPELVFAEVGVQELRPGMVLRVDVLSKTDVLLAAANQTLTGALIQRIANFQSSAGVIEPILVAYPKNEPV